MSAYDKLAACLFNFKCKAPERGGASELEGEQNMMKNGVRGAGRCVGRGGGQCIAGRGGGGRGVRLRCCMSVCGTQIRQCTSLRAGCPRPGV